MRDYVDIGVFAAGSLDKEGHPENNPLYLHKYWLSTGEHTIVITVQGKPISACIDPYSKLIDHTPADNIKTIE